MQCLCKEHMLDDDKDAEKNPNKNKKTSTNFIMA